jgi:hypothetical protein
MTKTFVVLFWLFDSPAAALAQAVIAGQVTDASGAPAEGVTVEATMTAPTESVRTARTDAGGRYHIVNLRPGPYRVRFTLPGWKTYEVHDVELTESLTASVSARLAAGELAQTVTVTAETPAVDVFSSKRAITLSGDLVGSLPTAGTYNALIVLIPGVVTSVNETVMGPATTSFPVYGGRTNEGRVLLDGLTVGSPPSGNSGTSYDVDIGQAQEVTFTVSGGLGEVETAGLVMNIVPKTGGSTTRGSVIASGTGRRLQSDNLTPSLLDQGVTALAPYSKAYDISATLGGPIAMDRAWYFLRAHAGGSTRRSTNVHYNVNAGNPGAWLYQADPARPAYSDRTFESVSGRIMWQLSRRNAITAFWDAQSLCRSCTGATPGLSEPARVSPEAVGVLGRRLDATQVTWSSPVTDRLLLDARYGGTHFGVGNFERQPNLTRDLVRVVEQCASGCGANGNIPGLAYRSQDFSVAHTGSYLWQGSLSYVTGTQLWKVGYQQTFMTDDRTWFTNNEALTYRFDNGQPNQLTQSISPWVNDARAGWVALFVQQQRTWTRLTLQGAVRFDRAYSWFPEQREGPSRFLPEAIVIPKTRGVDSYKDINPRIGIAYDVAGNGRTALKMSVGRYLEGVGVSGVYANTNPTLRMPQTTMVFGAAGVTRAWSDANGNFVPDCDLRNANAQDLRAVGGDACGVLSNVNFGRNVLTNTFDPAVLSGWGVRPSDWSLALSIQQQIGRQSALSATYTRRSFQGFTVADNTEVDPSDLTLFQLAAPSDSRLPGGGGYVIPGLYDVAPAKAGVVSHRITSARSFGRWSQYFQGIDVTLEMRVGRSLTVAGGVSSGQSEADNCEVRAHLPELATTTTGTSPFGAGLLGSAVTPVSPYCRVTIGMLTQVRGLSSFRIPRIDVQLAATFQSKPGALLAANYAAPNTAVAPALGRNLSGDARNITLNLIEPGSMYGDRINQFDLRAAKLVRRGRTTTVVGVDVYNVLNSNAVLTYNNTFVPQGPWLQPLTIMTPRLLKFTAQLDW